MSVSMIPEDDFREDPGEPFEVERWADPPLHFNCRCEALPPRTFLIAVRAEEGWREVGAAESLDEAWLDAARWAKTSNRTFWIMRLPSLDVVQVVDPWKLREGLQ